MSFRQKASGQGVVEFALFLPILLLIIMGGLELGRVLQMHIVVTNAAREGAYYLSYAENSDNSNCASGQCFLNTVAAVQAEGNNSGVTIAAADIAVTGCTGGASEAPCHNGTTVAVTVTQQAPLNIFRFYSGPHQVTHTIRMVVQ